MSKLLSEVRLTPFNAPNLAPIFKSLSTLISNLPLILNILPLNPSLSLATILISSHDSILVSSLKLRFCPDNSILLPKILLPKYKSPQSTLRL